MCKPTEAEKSTGAATKKDATIVYSEEELDAMRQVKAKLMEEHGIEESRIGKVFLAVTVINSKLRVDESVAKIVKLLGIMEQLGAPDAASDTLWRPEAAHELAPYAAVGPDHRGASTIWIVSGRKVPLEKQKDHVYAATMHFLAAHADAISLHEGISFIIDVSKSAPPPKIGNEKELQKLYQCYPQRPQTILISGTNMVTRVIVNASIKVASLFAKQKVLDRISFVTVEQAANALPEESRPTYLGGKGGGIDNVEAWVKERLESFPVPEL